MSRRNINSQILKFIFWILIAVAGLDNASAQTYLLKGTVTDKSTGEPLPGATLQVKGTNVGTVTDIDGKFRLRVRDKQVLVCSFIGYITQEIPVGARKVIEIQLAEDKELLEEVVVTGYGVVRKSDLTGSVKSVKIDDIPDMASTSVDQMLQGRLAGVRMTSNEGSPGQPMDITIRGTNTITGESDPLYVVDGFPVEDNTFVTTIDPSDIERVDILKDASATAIYGARGANGVVIITTKAGKSGKSRINVNFRQGFSAIPKERRLDVLSVTEFVKLQEELGSDAYGDIDRYKDVGGMNWQDRIFKSGQYQNLNVSMTGGSDQTQHVLSLGYVNEDGTLLSSGFKRLNGRLKLDHKLSLKVKVGANISYSHTKYTGMKMSSASVSAIKSAIMFRPVIPLDQGVPIDDEFGGFDPDDLDAGYYPPDKTLENTDREEPRDVFQVNGFLNYDITKKLKLRMSGGYTYDNRQLYFFYNTGTNQADRGGDGINGSIQTWINRNYLSENMLTYNYKQGEHKINALGGITYQKRDNFSYTVKTTNFPLDDFGWNDLSLGAQPKVPNSTLVQTSVLSFISRVNYDYKQRYLVTASLRADGSSKFPSHNRFGYFPSFALAWRAIEEDFIKDLDIFSNLKLKLGYGSTGNDRVGVNDAVITYGTGTGYYFGDDYLQAVYQKTLANSDLKWETTNQVNFGLEVGFLDNRLTSEIEMYYKKTSDLLLDALVPPTTGFRGVKENSGSIMNKGIELSIHAVVMDTKDFDWTSTFNISFNRNKVLRLSKGEDLRLFNPSVGGIFTEELFYALKVDEPVGVMYGYQYDGLYQIDDFIEDPSSGSLIPRNDVVGMKTTSGQIVPGMPKYNDITGDGMIDENDRGIIGNSNPVHDGGLSNRFKYKGFDLNVLMTWSYGNDIFNANRAAFGWVRTQRNRNYLAEVANRWTPENPIEWGVWGAPVGVYKYNLVYNGMQMSDFFIEDGSYLRIKNVSLGYSIPKKYIDKYGIKSMRVAVTGDNLYTFTKYSGYDPEVSVKSQAMFRGIDYSSYPRSRTISFSVNMNF